MPLPRVLIVDDHRLFADGVAEILRGRCEVVGFIADGGLVQDAVERLKPDVMLLDISLPTMNGLEALARLDPVHLGGCKVIMLTMYRDPRLVTEALKAGARGFTLKESSGDELLTAVDTVLHGELYLTPSLAAGSTGG